MKYSLTFPTPLDMLDRVNDNVDVLVEWEDGKRCVFVVATPSNLSSLMKKDNIAYIKPGAPFLFVEELTEVNIRTVVEAVMEDPVLLHIYGEDLW